MNYRFFLLTLAVLLIATGCSDKVPLKGTVTFTDDGTPVPTGRIVFQSPHSNSYAIIKEDGTGTYAASTDKDGDGIKPGTYRVYFSGIQSTEYRPDPGVPKMPDGSDPPYMPMLEDITPLVDSKYNSVETSDITITVDKSTKTYDFQLDRAPRR